LDGETVVTGADLLARIGQLETQARPLEPNSSERLALREPVVDYAERFLEALKDLPAYHDTDDLGAGIWASTIGEGPGEIGAVLDLLREHVDGPGLNPASAGHLAYIPGGGIYTSALGDYLADVTNRYAGVFFGGPGAVRLENLVIDWVRQVVGYPESALGNHASCGSVANMIALATARDAAGLTGKDYNRVVLYLTSQAHHCITKSLRFLGLGECVVRQVALDDRYRMRPDDLADQIQKDRTSGLRPWVVVASAGSTDVGAIDPLDAIADVTAHEGIWFHVDGAYGGFFALTTDGTSLLKGMERSDSLVVDPHKTLFLPYGSGVLLVRDGAHLAATHRYQANYMQDAAHVRDEPSPADLSPELTRPFRALRLWLPLMVHGVGPFRAALEEKMLLAKYFHEEVARLGFWVGPPPELSVSVFRYIPERYRASDAEIDWDEVNAYNRRLVREIRRDGRVFLSSTTLEGRFTIRLATVVHRTHLDTIRTTLAVLEEIIERLGR
jgi:glutamate/tyrosine decarboxylase-like PLP-dependent enzyme